MVDSYISIPTSNLSDGASNSALQATSYSRLADILIKLSNPLTVIGAFYPAVQAVSIASLPTTQVTGAFFQAVQPISATALPLPLGAALSSLQILGNSSLTSIDSKLPAQGQALMSASFPITIASNQSAIPVTGVFFQNTQPISGTVTANAGTGVMAVTGPLTDTQLRAIALPVSGTFFPATQPVSGTFFQATQPVSASALPLPSGASTGALQTTGNASIASIDTKTPALVGGRQPVDGSGVTQPISASSLPLPTGASTSVNQATANTSLANLDGKVATAANQVLNGTATQATLTISTVPVPLRVGAANMVGRRSIIIQPNSAGYFYGYTALVQPFALTNGQFVQLNLGENITIWAVKTSGTNTVIVAELS